MVVIVLGTVASASTWAFNVVRAVLALADPRAVSLYAETGADIMANLSAHGGSVVVKAHRLDRSLVALAPLLNAKIILTDRDPLDSVVSQRERFGHAVKDAVLSICRTYAAMAALPPDIPTLALSYETKFAADPATIPRIAEFLDVRLARAQAQAIFEAHRAETLKRRIDAWAKDVDPSAASTTFDDATHWHPGHLRDGQAGKGRERLSAEEVHMVASACAPWRQFRDGTERVVSWPPPMFTYAEGLTAKLALRPDERWLVRGPPCALPAGRWRATPMLCAPSGKPVFARIEAGTARRDPLALRIACVGDGDEDEASLSFTHLDHDEPVEVRISSMADSLGALTFEGVKLRYLGPARAGSPTQALPVSLGLPAPAGKRATKRKTGRLST